MLDVRKGQRKRSRLCWHDEAQQTAAQKMSLLRPEQQPMRSSRWRAAPCQGSFFLLCGNHPCFDQ